MFSENTKATLSVVCEHLGLGNVKRVSLRIKDVVADDMCEFFGVFHVQTVPTFFDTARIPLTTFTSGRFQVAEVPLRGEPPLAL
jgi:hypothetical protein